MGKRAVFCHRCWESETQERTAKRFDTGGGRNCEGAKRVPVSSSLRNLIVCAFSVSSQRGCKAELLVGDGQGEEESMAR